ncbi:MAG: 7-carboxy-7-deazaguanine synthase QueE [Candidatus Gastranaerophilales bacterium]|nr:7-carboxy-7-deazaguanine synthase QueE [Candidatus Gastranaerophilales bacterium]
MRQSLTKAKIKEIFTSLQGEGPYVGEKHLFIRFCYCNLNCHYCDTDFKPNDAEEYTVDELYNKIKDIPCNAISFTGAEPLVEKSFLKIFLEKYKSKLNKKIYLETNGTLHKELSEIIDFIDIVSMDIKLQSATKEENKFHDNEEFINIAKEKELFIKIVFDNKITDEEIIKCANLAKKYNLQIILQPKMPLENDLAMINIFDKFFDIYQNIRLIPQTHKFLNLA